MAMLVRIATPADAEAVGRVGEVAFAAVRRVYRPNPAAHAHLAAVAPCLKRLVAEVNGQIVGTVRFGILDCNFRIMGLGVLPTFQRQGVARALLAQLTNEAKAQGCSMMALYTITKTGNVGIFGRLGFHVVLEQPDAYSVSIDGEPLIEAYMVRPIA